MVIYHQSLLFLLLGSGSNALVRLKLRETKTCTLIDFQKLFCTSRDALSFCFSQILGAKSSSPRCKNTLVDTVVNQVIKETTKTSKNEYKMLHEVTLTLDK
jgi:hypothetical protein